MGPIESGIIPDGRRQHVERYAWTVDVSVGVETRNELSAPPVSGRTSPRHAWFDYCTPAAYVVTVCTHNRWRLFGHVEQGEMNLNAPGRIVVEEWHYSEALRDEVIRDAYVVMPDHIHGIVCIVPPEVDDVSPRGYHLTVDAPPAFYDPGSTDGKSGDTDRSRLEYIHGTGDSPNGPRGRSLSSLMAGFKSAVTTRINRRRRMPGTPVWQSRYPDRISRTKQGWRTCRRSIERNPARWWEDQEHY